MKSARSVLDDEGEGLYIQTERRLGVKGWQVGKNLLFSMVLCVFMPSWHYSSDCPSATSYNRSLPCRSPYCSWGGRNSLNVSPVAKHQGLKPFQRKCTPLAVHSWIGSLLSYSNPCGTKRKSHRSSMMLPSFIFMSIKGTNKTVTTTMASLCYPSQGRF